MSRKTIERAPAASQTNFPKRRASRLAATATAAAMAAVALGGCVSDGQYASKEGWGTLLGAGTGALVGSQIGQGRGQLAAVAIGTLAGGFLGNQVGQSLDRADRLYMNQAQNAALQRADWQPVNWSNPDSGNSGTVTPVRTIQHTGTGEVCREYRTTVSIGGRVEEGYGTACRTADGAWRISG